MVFVVSGTPQTTPQLEFCLASAQCHWPSCTSITSTLPSTNTVHCSQKCNTISRTPYTQNQSSRLCVRWSQFVNTSHQILMIGWPCIVVITLVDFQLDAQNSYLFTYNTFIRILYMFRALPCSSSGGLRRNCIYMQPLVSSLCKKWVV